MSYIFNIFGIQDGFNMVLVIAIAAVLLAVNLLFKFSVRKPAITKLAQTGKKQKVTLKQKGEKANSERQVNPKEKKTVVTDKELETSSHTMSTKPNRIVVTNEKTSKQTSSTKKQQVAGKTGNSPKKTKKPENFAKSLNGNKVGEGEWQMVVKKKQKQAKSDELVKTVVPYKSQISPEKPTKNINKSKINIIEKEEAKPVVTIDSIESNPLANHNQQDDHPNITDITPVTSVYISNNVAYTEGIEYNTLIEKNVPTNVAFDEIGDDVWINTKPQKKNRKKVLRE